MPYLTIDANPGSEPLAHMRCGMCVEFVKILWVWVLFRFGSPFCGSLNIVQLTLQNMRVGH